MKVKKIIINLVTFFSYFIYEYLFIAIFQTFNLNFYEMDTIGRIVFLSTLNIIYMIILFFIFKNELKEDGKDFLKNKKEYLKKYVIYYMLGVILMGFSNIIIQKLTNTSISGNEETIRNYIKLFPIYMSFTSLIYAPFVEEMIFRKTIRNIIDNKYIFIVLSGVIFGALHISDFTNINQILLGIPYIIMGLDFAYIYYKTNNIFTTMTFHIIHNAILLSIQLIGGLVWKNIIILELPSLYYY